MDKLTTRFECPPIHCCVRRNSSEKIMDDLDSQASAEHREEKCDHLYRKKRTLVAVRSSLDSSFGFALQSYVFKRRCGGFTEQLTYVDYVRDQSPAANAGIKRGDVILSINGFSAIGQSHASLVLFINSLLRMKIVLVFQNIARIVQLSTRSIQLQYILKEKEMMIKYIDIEEKKLVSQGTCSRLDAEPSPPHPEDPIQPDRVSHCSVQSEYDNSDFVTRL